MELIENVIFQNYLQYKEILNAMMVEVEQLPKGNLTYRTAKGHRYCYLQYWVPKEKACNQRVVDSEIASVEQALVRRESLLKNIKILQQHLQAIEKEFPHFSFANTTSQFLQNTVIDSQKPYQTLNGEFVRSKSEVIIANELYIAGIPYKYEEPLYLEGYSQPFLPDFTISVPSQKNIIYWEHCGLMNDENYRKKWERKKRVYERFGISEWNRTLIVTYETYAGSLNLTEIRQHIQQLKCF